MAADDRVHMTGAMNRVSTFFIFLAPQYIVPVSRALLSLCLPCTSVDDRWVMPGVSVFLNINPILYKQ
jgi:hypothetical protein